VRDPSRPGDHRRERAQVRPELEPAGLHVGAADVELEAVHRRSPVESLDDDGELLDGKPDDVHEDARARDGGGETRQVLATYRVEPRIGEADGVDHPSRELGDARCRIALSWLDAHRLGHEPAYGVELDDARQLVAVAGRAGGEHDRVLEGESGDVHRERGVRARCDPRVVARRRRSGPAGGSVRCRRHAGHVVRVDHARGAIRVATHGSPPLPRARRG
jgi:hypothetical protein